MRLLIGLLLGLTAHAATPPLPKLIQEVQEKYAKVSTISAEFTQSDYSAALDRDKKSSGNFLAKKPEKLRWETLQPDTTLLVSDGHKYWFYTPPFDKTEHGQVVERKSSEIQSRLAHALLQGRFSSIKGMKITEKNPITFELVPRKNSAGAVEKAEIQIDPKEKLIKRVKLFHTGGNRSEIILSKVELGSELSDDLFYFIPPPGTIQIKD